MHSFEIVPDDATYKQVSDVTADLVLHHGSSQWWSFHDVNSLDAYGCGSLSGPMAVVVSEETPRKLPELSRMQNPRPKSILF